MLKTLFAIAFLLHLSSISFAQDKNDTLVKVKENYITLSEIVVNSKLMLNHLSSG